MAKKYLVKVKGNNIPLSVFTIDKLIKQKIRNSKSIINLFKQFEVSLDRLNSLQILITPLEDMYAETDNKTMKINSILFEDGEFFSEYFFVIAHEIVHFLSRCKEEDSYFNDPEETLGFVSSIAYELEQHNDLDIVWNKIYNKVKWHFHNEVDAKEFFSRMIDKSKRLMT